MLAASPKFPINQGPMTVWLPIQAKASSTGQAIISGSREKRKWWTNSPDRVQVAPVTARTGRAKHHQ